MGFYSKVSSLAVERGWSQVLVLWGKTWFLHFESDWSLLYWVWGAL